MSFFEELKVSLKDKWLDYYQANYSWLKLLMEEGGCHTDTNSGSRPNSLLILGAVSVLEPSLRDMLPAFCSLDTNEDKLVEVLELDFDPEQEIEKRTKEAANFPKD